MSSRTRNSMINISTGLIGQMLSLLISFGVRTIFIYQLGATYLSVSGLFGNILALLSFAELGFGQAIIYALYKPISENNEPKIGALMALFRKVYVWMFGVVAILGLSLTPFIEFFIKEGDDIPNLHLIYVLYVASTAASYLFAYKKSLLFASQRTYVATTISYWFLFIGAALQIIVLCIWQNYIFYLVVQIVNTIIQDITISRKTDKLYPYLKPTRSSKLPTEEIQSIKQNVKALIIYKIGTLSLNATDNIIISKFVGLLQVGFFSNYWLISTSVGGFLSSIFSNITASIGHLNATETTDARVQMFFRVNMATFWFYGISSICLYTCMTPFIHLWLGEYFTLSNAISFIVAFNQFIGGMLFASFNYRQTMGLFVQGKLRPIISAVLNIVISIILAIYWGLPGVLWGTAITRLLTNAWFDPYIVFKRGLNISPLLYFKQYIPMVGVYLLTAAICGWVTSLFSLPLLPNLIAIFVTTLALAFLLFCMFYGHTPEIKYLLNVARNSSSILKRKS